MNIAKILLLCTVIASCYGYSTSRQYVFNESEPTSIDSYGGQIAVSDDLVGIYYREEFMFVYNYKEDFARNVYSNQRVIKSGPIMVLSFKATSEYIVTAYVYGNRVFTVWAASYNASANPRITTKHWYTYHHGYTQARYSALSETFYLFVERWYEYEKDVIYLAPLATKDWSVFFKSYFDAITIRDVTKNSKYKIYYSYVKDSGVELNAQTIYINKTVDSHISYNIGTNNCANKIEANDKVVVVACMASSNGMLSIFRESDMTLYKEIQGYYAYEFNDVYLDINGTRHYYRVAVLQISIISSNYYHQVYFNSRNPTSLEKITTYVAEVFLNQDNTDFSTNVTTVLFQPEDSDIRDYGRYFYVEQSSTFCNSSSIGSSGCKQNNMYFGGIKTSPCRKHVIDVVPICAQQVENQSSDTCYSPGEIQSSLDSQQETDDLCYCQIVTNCSKCEYKNGCSFVDGTCYKRANFETDPDPLDVFDTCNNQDLFQQERSICGPSSVNPCSKTISQLKPAVFTPANTLCQWNLECVGKFSMNIKVSPSSVEQVSIRQTSDGVVTELSNRRNLIAGRQLSTSVIYSVSKADLVEIAYRNSQDHNSTDNIFVIGYEQASDDNKLLIILFITFGILACAIFSITMFICWCCENCKCPQRIQSSNDYIPNHRSSQNQEPRNRRILPDINRPRYDCNFNSSSYESEFPSSIGLSQNYLDNLEYQKPRRMSYCNDASCCICLQEFITGDNIVGLNNCRHVFHKNCFAGWISNGKRNCPRCGADLSVTFDNVFDE